MLLPLVLAAAAQLPVVPVERVQLDNGLTVLFSQDRRAPVVAVDLWYRVGAVNERPGRSGFAHLFEHLMFQGSAHLRGDERAFFSLLERNGATNVNGATEWDHTSYYETVPSDRLELALWMESERLGFLLEALDQHKLDTQREVVRNERRQTLENVPYGSAEERLVQLLYPAPHPYHGNVIGSHADLEAATLEDVRAFFRTYYTPQNAVLAIVGDFDPAAARRWVERDFGSLPRGDAAPPVIAPPPRPRGHVRVEVRDDVQLERVFAGWVGPGPLQGAPMQALLRVLAGGKSSRLYDRLVYRRKIAQDVSASFDPSMQLGGLVELSATVQEGHRLEEVEAALLDEVRALREAPPSPAELERAKRGLRAGAFASMENVGGGGGKADQLAWGEFWAHDPNAFFAQLAALLAVTPADVQAAAREFLADGDAVVVAVRRKAAP